MENENYVYIVECSDGTLYTGWTNNLQRRIDAHNEGKGARYTRGRTPVKLVYCHGYDTKQKAMSAEYRIKHMNKQEKLELIESSTNRKRKIYEISNSMNEGE